MRATPDAVGAATFEAEYRVRFDEAGPDGRVRTSTLLRYAQDVAWQHSEDRGFDRAWYAERGLGWVARSVSIAVLGPVGVSDTLRVSTRVTGHGRVWARRLAEARRVEAGAPSSEPVARVVTEWVIVDGRGRPVRIPMAFGLDFASPEAQDGIQHAEGPVGPPTASLRIRVRPHDLDPVGHVNNAAYLDWLEEALLAADAGRPARGTGQAIAGVAAVPRSAILEYLASVSSGDEVDVVSWLDGPAWQARIARGRLEILRASGRWA